MRGGGGALGFLSPGPKALLECWVSLDWEALASAGRSVFFVCDQKVGRTVGPRGHGQLSLSHPPCAPAQKR